MNRLPPFPLSPLKARAAAPCTSTPSIPISLVEKSNDRSPPRTGAPLYRTIHFILMEISPGGLGGWPPSHAQHLRTDLRSGHRGRERPGPGSGTVQP